jgi:hypothetical protein
MFLYFVGGALGSLGSAAAYQHYGWLGVCLLGGGLGVLGVGYGVWIHVGPTHKAHSGVAKEEARPVDS